MQFWEKMSPAMKIGAIVAVLAGLLAVVQPKQEEVVVTASEEDGSGAETVVSDAPEVEETVVQEVAQAPAAPEAVEKPKAEDVADAAPTEESTAEDAVAEDPMAETAEEEVAETDEDTAAAEEVVEDAPEAEETAEAVEDAPETEETAEDASTDTAGIASAPEAEEGSSGPTFDVVRIAPDGNSLVAGQAAPGSTVIVRMGNKDMAEVTADQQGKFVAFFDLPPSTVSRSLTLIASLDGVGEVTSNDIVFVQPGQVVAPEPEPEVVAQEDAPEAPAAEEQPAEPEAPASPTVVVANDEGVRVLQSEADTDPVLEEEVLVEVITYTDTGDVELAGRAAPGQFVRLYLNNQAIGGFRVDEAGKWGGTFDQIDPGVYLLRADMVDEDGKVVSRFETPFQRVDRSVVLALAAQEQGGAAEPAAEDTAPAPVETPVAEADTAAEPEVVADATPEPKPEPVRVPVKPFVVPPAPVPTGPTLITVQPGNTLWAIAKDSYGDGLKYVEVFQANRDKIRNPDLIYPGQIFEVPPTR